MKSAIIILALLSTTWQFWGIVIGKVKAPRAPWIIWFIIGLVCLVVNYGFNGMDFTSQMLGSLSLGNSLIVGYILIKDRSGWTKRETSLLIATILIISFWLVFKIWSENHKTFLWATIFSQVLLHGAHFIGVWNHWQKVWNDPFTEVPGSWVCRCASAGLALVAMIQTHQPPAAMISPVYAVVTTLVLLGLIVSRRKTLTL